MTPARILAGLLYSNGSRLSEALQQNTASKRTTPEYDDEGLCRSLPIPRALFSLSIALSDLLMESLQ